uniref:Putative conserved plasma membrane protein n=1 Tax=Ixodes ricinus TaxID=34613 RepID=A0A131XPG5_IXORI
MATTVVRQTTTVTSSSSSSPVVVSFNTSFITSIGGLFTILELVLGIIVFSLMYNYFGFVCASGFFLMFISFAYWLMCFYFLLSAMLSITGSLLPSTFFFFLFHAFGFVLYISGGIAVLAVFSKSASCFAGIIAGGVFALIAAVCHLVHVAFLYKGSRIQG